MKPVRFGILVLALAGALAGARGAHAVEKLDALLEQTRNARACGRVAITLRRSPRQW